MRQRARNDDSFVVLFSRPEIIIGFEFLDLGASDSSRNSPSAPADANFPSLKSRRAIATNDARRTFHGNPTRPKTAKGDTATYSVLDETFSSSEKFEDKTSAVPTKYPLFRGLPAAPPRSA